ncbi:MAG: TIGR02594 family protein [Rhizobium sp.]|nr:MAG: TIGR02594 family protein [Rhizobium sp.]
MTTADLIVRLLRPEAPDQKFTQGEVDLINALAASWNERSGVRPRAPDPAWVRIGRSDIGQREIVGPKNNPWIAKGWAKLGWGGYNDDETPWCGFAVADWLHRAGLPYPKAFPSAASYATYGEAVKPMLGAIGVKKRKGGNHVFIIVGITPGGRYYKALGGNQGNMVNIVDIAVDDVNFVRWPKGQPFTNYLPVLPRGTISKSEA